MTRTRLLRPCTWRDAKQGHNQDFVEIIILGPTVREKVGGGKGSRGVETAMVVTGSMGDRQTYWYRKQN